MSFGVKVSLVPLAPLAPLAAELNPLGDRNPLAPLLAPLLAPELDLLVDRALAPLATLARIDRALVSLAQLAPTLAPELDL